VSREYLICGNWKMNLMPVEASELAGLIKGMHRGMNTQAMVAPSFVCLPSVAEKLKGSDVMLAAQNMASVESGAHTGETSVLMLKTLGVRYVILGHSERRHIYGETNTLINEKVKLALEHDLGVILCIGETLEERENGEIESICFEQIEAGLSGIRSSLMSKVVIAYEPVWAIGTGKTASPGDAEAVHKACRGKLTGLYSADVADSTVIQYGGSVKPENVAELMAQENIDGALVGGASLEANSFARILTFNTKVS